MIPLFRIRITSESIMKQANQILVETVYDSDEDPGVSEHDGTLFGDGASLTRLRELCLERVGVLEAAYTYNCAHSRDDCLTIIRKLLDLNQNPIDEEEYKQCITQISRQKLSYTVKTTSYCEGDFMYCSEDEDEDD